MRIHPAVLALAMALPLLTPMTAQDLEVALQRTIQEETATGNLQRAIQEYKRIASTARGNRELAARALLHMAECYRKMGDAESQKVYAQILREYPDQKEAAAEARRHLGGGAVSPGMVSRRVWSGPGVDTYGAVSPDGRYISHVIWRTGALALYDLASGTDRELVPNQDRNDNAEESAISKDGRQVAYSFFNHQTNRYELRLANINGDPNPRRLYDNEENDWVAPYDWSPDNKWVAVEIKRQDHTAQIGLVSVPEGSLRILKSVDWRGAGRIFFSPDGRFLGYDLPVSDINRQHHVFVLAADGSRETAAVTHPSLNFMMGWSPDGRLLFASDRTGAIGLWCLAMADGKPQGSPELLRPAIGWPEPMGVSRSGALFYSASTLGGEGSHIQIGAFDFETGKFVAPLTEVPHPYGDSISSPVWSPDGKYLAYLSDHGRAGSSNAQNNGEHVRDYSVVIRSAETGHAIHELPVKLIGLRQVIRWALDGRSVIVSGRDFKGRSGIFRVDAETGDMAPLSLNVPRSAVLYLSSDEKSLYWKRMNSGGSPQTSAFVRRDLVSGDDREIVRRPLLGALNVSPDEKFIATVSVEPSTNSRIMLLIPSAGGDPRTVMQVPAEAPAADPMMPRKGLMVNFIGWAPDSGSVIVSKYDNDRPQFEEFWLAPVDGRGPHKLELDGEAFPGRSGRSVLAVSPAGKRIAVSISEAVQSHTSEVWVLENFLPKAGSK
jgi:Tol biopolymer transport system component